MLDAMRFFFSYARGDAVQPGEGDAAPAWRPHFERFFRDLVDAVQEKVPKAKPFRDIHSLQVGDVWEKSIIAAIADASVFVCLYSPRYFESEYCAKEWEIFRSRLGGQYAFIVPVRWTIVATEPEAVAKIQSTSAAFPPIYGKLGMSELARRQPDHANDYRDAIVALRDLVVTGLTHASPPPVLAEPHPEFKKVSNPFLSPGQTARSQPSPEPRPTADRDGGTRSPPAEVATVRVPERDEDAHAHRDAPSSATVRPAEPKKPVHRFAIRGMVIAAATVAVVAMFIIAQLAGLVGAPPPTSGTVEAGRPPHALLCDQGTYLIGVECHFRAPPSPSFLPGRLTAIAGICGRIIRSDSDDRALLFERRATTRTFGDDEELDIEALCESGVVIGVGTSLWGDGSSSAPYVGALQLHCQAVELLGDGLNVERVPGRGATGNWIARRPSMPNINWHDCASDEVAIGLSIDSALALARDLGPACAPIEPRAGASLPTASAEIDAAQPMPPVPSGTYQCRTDETTFRRCVVDVDGSGRATLRMVAGNDDGHSLVNRYVGAITTPPGSCRGGARVSLLMSISDGIDDDVVDAPGGTMELCPSGTDTWEGEWTTDTASTRFHMAP